MAIWLICERCGAEFIPAEISDDSDRCPDCAAKGRPAGEMVQWTYEVVMGAEVTDSRIDTGEDD